VFPKGHEGEEVRQGDEPDQVEPLQPHDPENVHNLDEPLRKDQKAGGEHFGEGSEEEGAMWERREYDDGEQQQPEGSSAARGRPRYGSFPEERDVWGSREGGHDEGEE
jgi:hypothetical protein